MNKKLDGERKAEGDIKVDIKLKFFITKHMIRHNCNEKNDWFIL